MTSIFFDLIGFITAIIALVYAYFLWSFQYWKKRDVPYLEPVIPWGNFENPRKRTKCLGDSIRDRYREAKDRGWKYCGMYAMAKPTFFVLDLDLIKQIMTKDFHNFVDRGIYTNEKEDPLSCHLFSLSGAKWKQLRSKISPTFTSGKLKGMFNTFVECGEILERYIEGHIEEGGIDIKEVLGNFSTDIIGSCAFGLECNSFEGTDAPFRVYGKKIFASSNFNNLKLAFSMNFPEIAAIFKLCTTPKEVSEFFLKVVEDTVAYREKNNYRRSDFLQLLIDLKNKKDGQAVEHKDDGKTLTFNELAAQCYGFFLGGFETTSSTMTFALYELSVNQECQDKAREEINRVLAKHDGKITYDSLSELKYMQQVIDETLRKHSPIPFVTRISAEDYKIPGEELILEKGTKVIIPLHAIHYDEEYYENPEVFDPDRFSDENKAARHPYAYLSFGEGSRMCLGERFAIMQTKVGLTTILKNFRMTLNEKTKTPLKMTIFSLFPTAIGGIWLNMEKL